MRSYRVSKSTATATATTTSVTASGVSQPESAAGQHQQGSFAGLSTTVRTPESTHIPVAEQPLANLRLLAEVSSSQLDPFEALTTHRPITFDEDQEQSASSLSLSEEPSLSNEPSRAADDANPIMEVEEPHELRFTISPDNNSKDTKIKITIGVPNSKIAPSIKEHLRLAILGTAPETVQTGITADPELSNDQNMAIKDSDSTDNWIMFSGDKIRPFQCSYEGCGRTYTAKLSLRRHFVSHIGDSQFRCYSGDCTGAVRYRDNQALARHIHTKHTAERRFECNICNRRFRRRAHLECHQQKVHPTEKEQNTAKVQKSPPKRKRKVDPFEALATNRVTTFDDEDQEQSASSLSLPDEPLMSNEPSQATDDANPIMEVAEPHGTEISEVPKRPSDQNPAIQDSNSTEKWILYSGDKTKPFKCGYKGCGRIYSSKQNLRVHFVTHIGDLQFRCYIGDCAGATRYCDSQTLARHIHKKHQMEKPYECNICNKRFSRSDNMNYHKKQFHSTEKKQNTKIEQKSPPKRGRKVDPFAALATHPVITFDDEDLEQSSLPDEPLMSNEPSQATDDANPIMKVAEHHETGISEVPKRPSDQNPAIQDSDTKKWIMYSGDEIKPFQCGYEGCGKTYTAKWSLQRHFVTHTGDSQFRCYTGDCTGEITYCDEKALTRHIYKKHTMERAYACDICSVRFGRKGHLKRHQQQMHSTEKEQTTKKESQSPPKRKRK